MQELEQRVIEADQRAVHAEKQVLLVSTGPGPGPCPDPTRPGSPLLKRITGVVLGWVGKNMSLNLGL